MRIVWFAIHSNISCVKCESFVFLILTPIVEREELFSRGVGEDSDIVSKVLFFPSF